VRLSSLARGRDRTPGNCVTVDVTDLFPSAIVDPRRRVPIVPPFFSFLFSCSPSPAFFGISSLGRLCARLSPRRGALYHRRFANKARRSWSSRDKAFYRGIPRAHGADQDQRTDRPMIGRYVGEEDTGIARTSRQL